MMEELIRGDLLPMISTRIQDPREGIKLSRSRGSNSQLKNHIRSKQSKAKDKFD
jgi:hypothetical protein